MSRQKTVKEENTDIEVDYSEKLIDAFLQNDKVKDIASQAEISTKTVQRLRKDSTFRQVIAERRFLLVNKALTTLQESLDDAVKTLVEVMTSDSTPPRERLEAVRLVMDTAERWGGNYNSIKSNYIHFEERMASEELDKKLLSFNSLL